MNVRTNSNYSDAENCHYNPDVFLSGEESNNYYKVKRFFAHKFAQNDRDMILAIGIISKML